MAADKNPTILIAEDEPAMLTLVARHIRSLGFNVIEAPDGDTAWRLAEQHEPNLVILDVMMPGMSGWEICKRIKMGSGRTGVIMLTGIGENLNEMTSSLFAADAWLNKPFDFHELDAKVRETLARYTSAASKKPSTKKASPAKAKPPKAKPAKAKLAKTVKAKPARKARAAAKPSRRAAKKSARPSVKAKRGAAAPKAARAKKRTAKGGVRGKAARRK